MIHRSVGFCGLGKMGLPMAQRLINAGHLVYAWNRSSDKAFELQAPGAVDYIACASLADVAEADLIIMCLADGVAVESVVFGGDGLAHHVRPGTVIVDHSTIVPSQTRDLAKRWQLATGGTWIDAPVSGGTAGAAAGTLAVVAGGDAASIAMAKPILAAYAARVTHMGDSGAGQVTKLANQTIVMTTIAGLAEAMRLAGRAGIDTACIPAALQGGWADSVLLQTLVPRMVDPPTRATGSIQTMLKDLDAVEMLAGEFGLALPVASLIKRWLVRAVEIGFGDADISQIVQVSLEE